MLKITNGINVFEVTSGAYESIYRYQNYRVIGDNKVEKDSVQEQPNEPAENADELFIDELQEKPISQWNKNEVKRYAAIKGIDITGTKSIGNAKDVIKAVMEAEGHEE